MIFFLRAMHDQSVCPAPILKGFASVPDTWVSSAVRRNTEGISNYSGRKRTDVREENGTRNCHLELIESFQAGAYAVREADLPVTLQGCSVPTIDSGEQRRPCLPLRAERSTQSDVSNSYMEAQKLVVFFPNDMRRRNQDDTLSLMCINKSTTCVCQETAIDDEGN